MKLAGIILAAGKGERLGAKNINKVTLPVAGRPIITYGIELFEKLNIRPIIVVVGFAQDSVKKVLKNKSVKFVHQEKPLGTADAVRVALKGDLGDSTDTVVINGDDCAFYTKELLEKLIKLHISKHASLTVLTVEQKNPSGLGRIIRDKKGKLFAIVEEKDATNVEREINEINPGCYIFDVKFLQKYLPKLKKSPVTGEYYLTDLVVLAVGNDEKVETLKASIPWRGVNTKEELQEAEILLNSPDL